MSTVFSNGNAPLRVVQRTAFHPGIVAIERRIGPGGHPVRLLSETPATLFAFKSGVGYVGARKTRDVDGVTGEKTERANGP